tara:strand:- start:1669 stop:2055 length:387 start_codon:yes stop_codon:yes gene_type:complete
MPKNKYRNKFEEDVANKLDDMGVYSEYEKYKLPYIIKKNYIPDFVFTHSVKEGYVEILLESKGFFRVGDTQKYKAIRDCLDKDQRLFFVLYNPNKKVRKGGNISMSEWCDKEGIGWCTLEELFNVFAS